MLKIKGDNSVILTNIQVLFSVNIFSSQVCFFRKSKNNKVHLTQLNQVLMTELGKYFKQKSINKSEISRKTGISSSRLSELSRNEKSRLKAEELYLISLALDTNALEILKKLYGHLKLKN